MQDREAGDPGAIPPRRRRPSGEAMESASGPATSAPDSASLAALRRRRERLLERLYSGNRELEKLESVGTADPRYEYWLQEWVRILGEYEDVDDSLKQWLGEAGSRE